MRFILAITILAIAGGMISTDLSSNTRSIGPAADSAADQSKPPIWAVKGEVLVTNRLDVDFSKYMVTFLELGADRCIPCKKMQPIMKEIAAAFPDRVQVVFYDVWKDSAPAEKYGIRSSRPKSSWIKRERRSPATSGSFPRRRSSSS